MPNLNSHETPAYPDCAECVELTETQNRLAREHNLVRNTHNSNRVQHAADVQATYRPLTPPVGRPKLYLAGPMSGLPNYNYPAFNRSQFILEAAGYEVINPTSIGQHEGWTHDDYLRAALALMLQADAVALLPGWENSKGAALEAEVSRLLPFHAARKTVHEWVGDALRADHYVARDTARDNATKGA